MIPADRLLTFAVAATILIVLPGPSVLFVLSRALVLGRRGALATVLGNALGEYALVVGVAFGLGVAVERSVALFTAVKLAGAAYLIFLGIRTIRARRPLVEELPGRPSDRRAGLQAFTVGITNPKSAIFFAAVLPQFVDRQAGHVPLQLLLLGLVYFLIALATDTVWSLGAGAARSWLTRSPRRMEVVGGASGLVMIGLGARLATTSR